MLRELPKPLDERVLVGIGTGDDAGVFRLSDELALVQTLDFFTPVVDDPRTFGAIAAANSMSDVYAMGGTPLTAMNIVCFPIGERGAGELAQILAGGAAKVAEAGAVLIGGHSVDDAEPKYGLAVTGSVDPRRIASNAGARPGDAIVLTKPLGTGIVTTAAKYSDGVVAALDAACASMLALNRPAAEAMRSAGIGPEAAVHAATDITGYGLLGHLYQLARASGVAVEIEAAAVPALPQSVELAAAGFVTRADTETREHIGAALAVDASVPGPLLSLLLDPQTSGGLAICVDEASADALARELLERGAPCGARIGHVVAGAPALRAR